MEVILLNHIPLYLKNINLCKHVRLKAEMNKLTNHLHISILRFISMPQLNSARTLELLALTWLALFDEKEWVINKTYNYYFKPTVTN